jgi:hypothetical protein
MRYTVLINLLDNAELIKRLQTLEQTLANDWHEASDHLEEM